MTKRLINNRQKKKETLLDVGHVQLADDRTAERRRWLLRLLRRRLAAHQVFAQFRQLLDEHIEHRVGQRALKNVEQLGGLAAHHNRVGQVLDAPGSVALFQVRLSHLNLLQEEPLHGLLVGEVRERRLGCPSG